MARDIHLYTHTTISSTMMMIAYMDRMDYVSMMSNELAYVECAEHTGSTTCIGMSTYHCTYYRMYLHG